MASALDLPQIEIFDHVNEIIAALSVLRNDNGTYSESRCLQGITTGSLLLTFCIRRKLALQDGKPIENDLVPFFYRTRTMQIAKLKRFVFCNTISNTTCDGSDVSNSLS